MTIVQCQSRPQLATLCCVVQWQMGLCVLNTMSVCMFGDDNNPVLKQASISRSVLCCAVADGTVHPLTATTLSFLKRLFTYKSALQILFSGSPDRSALINPVIDVAPEPFVSVCVSVNSCWIACSMPIL